MPRNEDHRHVRVGGREALLDLEPGNGTEMHVEDDARGRVGVVRRQEFLRGRERGYGDPFRAQKPGEGGAHRGVVVDDGDPGAPAGRSQLSHE